MDETTTDATLTLTMERVDLQSVLDSADAIMSSATRVALIGQTSRAESFARVVLAMLDSIPMGIGADVDECVSDLRGSALDIIDSADEDWTEIARTLSGV